jgi:glycine cleavage system regulatory protein
MIVVSNQPKYMKNYVVLTALSKDRPGLVERIAGIIAAHGGNWESSRMSRLGGQFAGIIQITIAEEDKADLLENFKLLEEEGIQTIVHDDRDDSPAKRSVPLKVKIIGQDHPGIIRDITLAVHKYDANVEELHTELANEPMSGEVIFSATIRLMLQDEKSLDSLRSDLENLAGDLMVDIEVIS